MELTRQRHSTQGGMPMPWKQVARVRIHGQQRPGQHSSGVASNLTVLSIYRKKGGLRPKEQTL